MIYLDRDSYRGKTHYSPRLIADILHKTFNKDSIELEQ